MAAGWAIGHPLIIFRLYRRVAQRTDLSGRDYLRALRPAVHGTAVMAAVLLLLMTATGTLPGPLRLALHVAAGALTYLAIMWFFHRDRFALVRGLLGRRRA